jgi:O-methyltransferase
MAISDSRLWWHVPVVFARMGMMLSKYWDSDRRRERLKLLLEIRSERDMLLLPSEACQIMSAIDAVKEIPGDIAELGVARGASAKMMTSCAPERVLHLFDTFDGISEPGEKDSARFYKGLFPETAKGLSGTRFAFVHLDADLYESTKAGLEWFYPRLNSGGILICHDFDTSAGVNRAFEEYFSDKP